MIDVLAAQVADIAVSDWTATGVGGAVIALLLHQRRADQKPNGGTSRADLSAKLDRACEGIASIEARLAEGDRRLDRHESRIDRLYDIP